MYLFTDVKRMLATFSVRCEILKYLCEQRTSLDSRQHWDSLWQSHTGAERGYQSIALMRSNAATFCADGFFKSENEGVPCSRASR